MRKLLMLAAYAGLGAAQNAPQNRCDAPRSLVFSKYEKLEVTDGWFEVYRLPGNVYALYQPRQAEHVFSYLIVGEKRALLFDSGFGIAGLDQVVKRLTSVPALSFTSTLHSDHRP